MDNSAIADVISLQVFLDVYTNVLGITLRSFIFSRTQLPDCCAADIVEDGTSGDIAQR